ncbi:hypothetical protein PanWU01x14_162990 [Parasponia andersonii]|uniref:Uncharacterized protein n=1 Tax=Parasponia andersonii TaxID=3476 RepID=A0A2P5CDB6_PARAD|nr:hypothetical protein PanWU01x14_162990 [Parasponia andersonii]
MIGFPLENRSRCGLLTWNASIRWFWPIEFGRSTAERDALRTGFACEEGYCTWRAAICCPKKCRIDEVDLNLSVS